MAADSGQVLRSFKFRVVHTSALLRVHCPKPETLEPTQRSSKGFRESPTRRRPPSFSLSGSSSSQYRRTLELVLQKGHASFRIKSSFPVQRISADRLDGYPPRGEKPRGLRCRTCCTRLSWPQAAAAATSSARTSRISPKLLPGNCYTVG